MPGLHTVWPSDAHCLPALCSPPHGVVAEGSQHCHSWQRHQAQATPCNASPTCRAPSVGWAGGCTQGRSGGHYARWPSGRRGSSSARREHTPRGASGGPRMPGRRTGPAGQTLVKQGLQGREHGEAGPAGQGKRWSRACRAGKWWSRACRALSCCQEKKI